MKLGDFNSYSKGRGNLHSPEIIIASQSCAKSIVLAADRILLPAKSGIKSIVLAADNFLLPAKSVIIVLVLAANKWKTQK
jgi:hypothetical protein